MNKTELKKLKQIETAWSEYQAFSENPTKDKEQVKKLKENAKTIIENESLIIDFLLESYKAEIEENLAYMKLVYETLG